MVNSFQVQDILHVPFTLVSYEEAIETIDEWRALGKRQYVAITNPHSVMLCSRDEEMDRATRGAGLVLPDGIGIVMAAGILGYRHQGRATGPSLMLELVDWGREKNYRHFFYGGGKGVADRLAERLSEQYPGIVVAGTYCPPFRGLTTAEDQRIVEKINATQPDIVWVGLGAPKQEKWMASHVGRIDAAALIGVGAAFDFHSGNVKWAPNWVRSSGVEWAYRLILEPKRMWRRNLDTPLFISQVITQRISQTFRRTTPAEPSENSSPKTWQPKKPR